MSAMLSKIRRAPHHTQPPSPSPPPAPTPTTLTTTTPPPPPQQEDNAIEMANIATKDGDENTNTNTNTNNDDDNDSYEVQGLKKLVRALGRRVDVQQAQIHKAKAEAQEDQKRAAQELEEAKEKAEADLKAAKERTDALERKVHLLRHRFDLWALRLNEASAEFASLALLDQNEGQ